MLPFRTILAVLIRHALSALAGALALNAFVDAAHLDAAANVIASVVGAFAFGLAAVVWSVIEKRYLLAPIMHAQRFLGLRQTGHVGDLIADVMRMSGGGMK